jgi:glycosyltransferase involved in cell wall biosynthesis
MLAVIETHPVQYHAPVYREIQAKFAIPVTAIYGSDFSVAGYHDREFGASFKWDTDLLSGYRSIFLSHSSNGDKLRPVSSVGLRRTLRELAPKAVLLMGYSGRFNRQAWSKSLEGRYPILFRGETTDHAIQRSRLKSRVRDSVLKRSYGKASRLLYIGSLSKEHYTRLECPEDRLVFSPYCVDASTFETSEEVRAKRRDLTRERLGVGQDETVLLFSGKLSLRKGPDLILNAVKLLPEYVRKNTTVVFLGSGDMFSKLEALAKETPTVKVKFVGFQNQGALSDYYHAADLLVLPSRYGETWGLVVNEALHHGLPCVVSEAVGCAVDLIEEGRTGCVFETNSSTSLASTLEKAYGLINFDEIRRNCRDKMKIFSVANAASGIAEAYSQVISN